MRLATSTLSALAVTALVAASSSCASIGIKQSLEPQLEQVQTIRSELTADWQALESELDSVEMELLAFSDQTIDAEGVDPQVVLEAIEIPADVSTDEVPGVQEEAEARMASFETSIEGLDDQTRSELEEMRTTGARLRQQLYVEIPAAMAALGERSAGVALELATIKATADQMDTVAKQNPLMTAADRSKFDSDHAALEAEIQGLSDLADEIAQDSVTYGERLAAATSQFNLQLSSMGQ